MFLSDVNEREREDENLSITQIQHSMVESDTTILVREDTNDYNMDNISTKYLQKRGGKNGKYNMVATLACK